MPVSGSAGEKLVLYCSMVSWTTGQRRGDGRQGAFWNEGGGERVGKRHGKGRGPGTAELHEGS